MVTITLPEWVTWLLLTAAVVYALGSTVEAYFAKKTSEMLQTETDFMHAMVCRMKQAMEELKKDDE